MAHCERAFSLSDAAVSSLCQQQLDPSPSTNQQPSHNQSRALECCFNPSFPSPLSLLSILPCHIMSSGGNIFGDASSSSSGVGGGQQQHASGAGAGVHSNVSELELAGVIGFNGHVPRHDQ